MIKEQFFPTTIYGKDVNLDTDELARHIINWSKEDEGVIKTNVNGWHSKTIMQTKPEYKELMNELFKMQFEIFNEEWLDREPRLGNMWANINYKDGYNKSHIHPNSLFSGVYYVKAPSNCGPITFYDPRSGVQANMPARKPGQLPKHLWRDTKIEPKENRILMFPAWLWHSVEPNKSNNMRISVSFNFIQHGF